MASTVVFTSVRGAPGCTVASLAFAAALAETGDTVWVEADPVGGVITGRAAPLSTRPSVEDVAFGDVRTADAVLALDAMMQRLGDLPVLAAPADGWVVSMALERPRRRWTTELAARSGTVVVDVGRIGTWSPAWPLVRSADLVVVVAAPEPVELAASLEWIERGARGQDTGLLVSTSAVVLTVARPRGLVRGYSADRLRAELGDRYVGELPFDARVVDVLLRGASSRHRSLRSRPLMLAARSLVGELSNRLRPPLARPMLASPNGWVSS